MAVEEKRQMQTRAIFVSDRAPQWTEIFQSGALVGAK